MVSEIIAHPNNVTESTDRSSSYEGKGRISGYTYIKIVNSTGIQFVSIHSEGRTRNHSGDIFEDD